MNASNSYWIILAKLGEKRKHGRRKADEKSLEAHM